MDGWIRKAGRPRVLAPVVALLLLCGTAGAPAAAPPAPLQAVAERLAAALPAHAIAHPGAVAADAREQGRWKGASQFLKHEPLASFGVRISLGEALSAAIALLVTLLLSTFLQRGLKRYGSRRADVNQAALYTISRLLHYLLMVVGTLLALQLAGIPLSQFAVFTGAIGVGLGFGLQAIFSNFISGLILLFDRSLKVGDFVELDDEMRGVVRAINIRSTLITTNDNIDVLVPNSEFVSKRLVNWTHGSVHRRIRIAFSASYDVDKELVKKAALEAAAQVPFTLSTDERKRPQVWLVEFGDNAVDYILAVWLTEAAARRNTSIKAAYLWELDTTFRKYGIDIPFPQQDLNLRSAFGLRGAEAIAALRGTASQAAAVAVAAGNDDTPPALDPRERELLARNDAKEETRQEIEEEAGRRATEARPPAGASPPG